MGWQMFRHASYVPFAKQKYKMFVKYIKQKNTLDLCRQTLQYAKKDLARDTTAEWWIGVLRLYRDNAEEIIEECA